MYNQKKIAYDNMLHDISWLTKGATFPPSSQKDRITRYAENELLFDGDHFGIQDSLYDWASKRVERVLGNYAQIVSFNVLLNYQRLMSLKTADLVCGEYPNISVASSPPRGSDNDDPPSQQPHTSSAQQKALKKFRSSTNFDAKLTQTVIDISRFGDAIWRWYIDSITNEKTFTVWSPKEWFPIVSTDGTNSIIAHVLAWTVQESETRRRLDVQVHYVGYYDEMSFEFDNGGNLGRQIKQPTKVTTGLDHNAVVHIKAVGTSSHVFGYDDYTQVDSILVELMTRIAQVSNILDKHADPSIVGSTSMLKYDQETGQPYFKKGAFYAQNPGDPEAKYLTWNGELANSFKQIDQLLEQLYILSEMGSALLGSSDGKSGQAISGTAMRFKMVNPLAKVRRISNCLTIPIQQLFGSLVGVDPNDIGVQWKDGLPNDPRETIEMVKLGTGRKQIIPSRTAIVEFFNRSPEEAQQWLDQIAAEPPEAGNQTEVPAPGSVSGVNPAKKGSATGTTDVSTGDE